MEQKKKGTLKLIGRRLLVFLLILVLILGSVLTAATQIRYTAENYTGRNEAYAARVVEQETPYLSDNVISRQLKYLQTIGHFPRTYKDFNLYADIAIANEDFGS